MTLLAAPLIYTQAESRLASPRRTPSNQTSQQGGGSSSRSSKLGVVEKGWEGSRHHTVPYNDPIPGMWPCEGGFPDWLDGKITQSVLSLSSGISHHLFSLHSMSLFPLSSQQAVENAGKRLKGAALINTKTRPWLKSRGSDRERDRDWNIVRGSLSSVALRANCLRNPMTPERQEGNKKCL